MTATIKIDRDRNAAVDFKSLFSKLPGRYVVFAVDSPVFTMVAASQSYLNVTDKTINEIIGKSLFDVFPDTSELAEKTGKGALQRSLETVMRTTFPDSMGVIRYDIATSTGQELRYWKATHYPIVIDNALTYIVQSTEDVTQSVRSTEQDNDTEQSLRFMADSMPQLVWVTRPDGYHEYYNKRWYEYTGTKPGSTDGEGWNDLFHPDDRVRANRVWQTSLKTGKEYEIKYRLYHAPTDSYRWVIGRAIPYRNSSGKIIKWYGTCTDVDDSIRELEERKRLEAELKDEKAKLEARVAERTSQLRLTNDGLRDEIKKRRSSEASLRTLTTELERSNKELENFAYVSSHDLQEPLRKIQAFGDILEQEYGEQLGDGMEYLRRMRSAAGRMSTLIEDLLAFSRVSTLPARLTKIDLNSICRMVVSDLETLIKKEGGVVTYDQLPAVYGDGTHMRQLLQNLISNGLKFHDADISPIVKISSHTTDEEYVIRIADNGIGIDQKHVEKIFAVFQRLNTRHTYDGNGIGLAVCKKIVERYGGTITVESTLGKGTTFIVRFPRRKEVA